MAWNYTAHDVFDDDPRWLGAPIYLPEAPVPVAHQTMEMVIVNLLNTLTLIIFALRLYLRTSKMKTFRADDRWMLASALFFAVIYWPCQIASIKFGSGLYWQNIPMNWRQPFELAQLGWGFYYIISSMIKVSICCCHLLIVPVHMRNFRRSIYALCGIIMALGLAEACLWFFNCKPFAANFDTMIVATTCLNLDIPRYCWLAISVVIDLVILWIPFKVLQETSLQKYEKRILMLVFGANLLGTATCIVGFYGIWMDRFYLPVDTPYAEVPFVLTNDLEILFYTLGASFPVLSPYLISWGKERSTRNASTNALPSWRRKLPDSDESIMLHSYSATVSVGRPEKAARGPGIERIQGWTLAMDDEEDGRFDGPKPARGVERDRSFD